MQAGRTINMVQCNFSFSFHFFPFSYACVSLHILCDTIYQTVVTISMHVHAVIVSFQANKSKRFLCNNLHYETDIIYVT